jgi:hypothetical protein
VLEHYINGHAALPLRFNMNYLQAYITSVVLLYGFFALVLQMAFPDNLVEALRTPLWLWAGYTYAHHGLVKVLTVLFVGLLFPFVLFGLSFDKAYWLVSEILFNCLCLLLNMWKAVGSVAVAMWVVVELTRHRMWDDLWDYLMY